VAEQSEKLIRASPRDHESIQDKSVPGLRVRVQYFARVRELAGLREEILDIEEKATVLDIVRILAKRHGEEFRQYIFDPRTGSARSYLQFLVNDDLISSLNGFSTVLTDNSSLAIFPPVGGG
jgi:MoaD family protein